MDRRQFLKNSTAAVAAAGTMAAPWRCARAQAGPIKIGLLTPLTGVVASGGKEMVEGVQFYLESVNYQIAGRKVELVIEDDASNPDTALQKARRLVEQGNCHMLIGDLLANTGLAVANYVKGTGTPYFIPIIAADDLTQRQRIKNVIRVAGYTGSAFTHPFGDWCLKQGYKKIATISQDYTFGHEQCGGLAQVFTEGGGEIVQQFWHPLNTADFSPYLGQLADLKVDAIFAMETGADATRLIQQYASFGLKGKFPLLGAMNATDQSVARSATASSQRLISPKAPTIRSRRSSPRITKPNTARFPRSTASRCIPASCGWRKRLRRSAARQRTAMLSLTRCSRPN
jgi:branched-chain amino acid transport system substrate-binding protein